MGGPSDYPADHPLLGGGNTVFLSPGNPLPMTSSRLTTGARTCAEDGGAKEEPSSRCGGCLVCAVVIAVVEQIFRFFQIVDIIVFIVEGQFLLDVFLDLFGNLFFDILTYLFFV